MAKNYGKEFESRMHQDFIKNSGATLIRLYDPGFGQKGISNISDFIGYKYPNIFILECKSKRGNTFPLDNLTQFEKLLFEKNKKIPGERVGAVIWFVDHDIVSYIPITTIAQMKKDGKKSINVKDFKSGKYIMYELPSVKRRVFMDTDYKLLFQLPDSECMIDPSILEDKQ